MARSSFIDIDATLRYRYNQPIMPYLIDGHNLIPKIPSLSLEDLDDEDKLIELLQAFCQQRGKNIEVIFDNAPPGFPRAHRFGRVTARFTRAGLTADDAIKTRLEGLHGAARNWTVVSSDHSVQIAAHAARANLLSSEDFSRLLRQTLDTTTQETASLKEEPLDPDEVDEWLQIFKKRHDNR
jgi:predicted RNA-binding protein with PIN domain